MISQTVEDRG